MHLRHGNGHFRRADYAAAISAYDECIELESKISEPYFLRGNAQAALGSFDDARKDYDLAIEYQNRPTLVSNNGKDKSTFENWFLFSIFFNRGNAKFALGDFQGAVADYSETIRLAPTFSEAFYNRGNANAELDHCRDATADFDSASNLGKRGAASFNKGNVLLQSAKFEESLEVFRALAKAPAFDPAVFQNVQNLEQIVSLLEGQSYEHDFTFPRTSEGERAPVARILDIRVAGFKGKRRMFVFQGTVGNTGNMGGDKQPGGKGFPGSKGIAVRIYGE